MKRVFFFGFLFGFLFSSSISAGTLKFFMKVVNYENKIGKPPINRIEFFVENNSPTQRFVFPYFKRGVNPLVFIVFVDGTLLKDGYAIEVKPRPPLSAYHDGRTSCCEPLQKSSFILPIAGEPVQFRFQKDGTYFIVAFFKKGDKWSEGLIASNILSFEAEKGKIKSSTEISKEALPSKIQSAFDKEMKQVELEETGQYPLLVSPAVK